MKVSILLQRRSVKEGHNSSNGSRRLLYSGGQLEKDAIVVIAAVDYFTEEVGQRRMR